MQLRTINKALDEKYPGLELVKGEGYFYFVGAGTEVCRQGGVYVPRLNHLTFDQWMGEADDRMKEVAEHDSRPTGTLRIKFAKRNH